MDKTASDYLNEKVNFGGKIMTRGEVYSWFTEHGYTRKDAEAWLIAYGVTHRG